MNLLTWEKAKGQYASGSDGFRNGVPLFSYHYDASRPKDSKLPPWKLTCSLPRIKSNLGNFENEDAAKAKAEEAFAYWLKITDLTPIK